MRIKSWVAVVAAVPLVVAGPAAHASSGGGPRVPVPAGTTAAYVVFDRQAGKIVAHRLAHRAYRSASVIKILIAIDFLERVEKVSTRDLAQLRIMLRSSDDDAASRFWDRGGKGAIVKRMAKRLGLPDTAPPPASLPGYWGYTSLSAYDVARTYRYLLDRAQPRVRDLIVGHLRASTRCGTDGFDQSFGIPGAIRGPWAVKQGWSGFGTVAPTRCANGPATASAATPALAAPAVAAQRSGVPDLGRPVLHTTGLVGKDDRLIMVLLTAHPAGATWKDCVRRTTALAGALHRSL